MNTWFFIIILLIGASANMLIGFVMALAIGRGPSTIRKAFHRYWPFGIFTLSSKATQSSPTEDAEKEPVSESIPEDPSAMIASFHDNDEHLPDDVGSKDKTDAAHSNISEVSATEGTDEKSHSHSQVDNESPEEEAPKFQALKTKKKKSMPPLLNLSDDGKTKANTASTDPSSQQPANPGKTLDEPNHSEGDDVTDKGLELVGAET